MTSSPRRTPGPVIGLPVNVAQGSATVDPGLRRDDDSEGIGFGLAAPAYLSAFSLATQSVIASPTFFESQNFGIWPSRFFTVTLMNSVSAAE